MKTAMVIVLIVLSVGLLALLVVALLGRRSKLKRKYYVYIPIDVTHKRYYDTLEENLKHHLTSRGKNKIIRTVRKIKSDMRHNTPMQNKMIQPALEKVVFIDFKRDQEYHFKNTYTSIGFTLSFEEARKLVKSFKK